MSEIAPKRNNPNLVLVNKLNDDEIGRIFSYFSTPSDVFNCLVVSRRFLEVSNSRGFENVTFDIQSAFRWEELCEEDEPFEEYEPRQKKEQKKKEEEAGEKKEEMKEEEKKEEEKREEEKREEEIKEEAGEKKEEEKREEEMKEEEADEEEEPPVHMYVRRIRLPEFIMEQEEFLHAIKRFPKLESIHFVCSKWKSNVKIHPEYLSHFADLRSLIFHGPFSLPKMKSFGTTSFQKLTRLEFDGCVRLDAHILDFSIFPRLKVLSVLGDCGRSPHTLKKILQLAPRLELLRICGCNYHKPVLSPGHYQMNEDGCSDVTGSYYFCKNCPTCPTCNQVLSGNIHVGIQEVCDGCDILICPTCVEKKGKETCVCENHENDAKTLCPECHKQDGRIECQCGERNCQDCRMKCEKCNRTVCWVECGTPFCEICQEGTVQNDWCKDCCESINCPICRKGPLCNGCVGICNKGCRKKRCVDCENFCCKDWRDTETYGDGDFNCDDED